MLTNLPPIYAVKFRKSLKAYLTGKNAWATSFYSELLLDTLFEDTDTAEVKELEGWYINGSVQEQVYSIRLPPMTNSCSALPARTDANLESIKGRTAALFKTGVLYARRKLASHLVSDQRDLQPLPAVRIHAARFHRRATADGCLNCPRSRTGQAVGLRSLTEVSL